MSGSETGEGWQPQASFSLLGTNNGDGQSRIYAEDLDSSSLDAECLTGDEIIDRKMRIISELGASGARPQVQGPNSRPTGDDFNTNSEPYAAGFPGPYEIDTWSVREARRNRGWD